MKNIRALTIPSLAVVISLIILALAAPLQPSIASSSAGKKISGANAEKIIKASYVKN